MYEYLQKLIDSGGVTLEQAIYIQRVGNNNPRAEMEFAVCDHGGVIVEVWEGKLRQRGAIFGVRRDGSFVDNALNPDWKGK